MKKTGVILKGIGGFYYVLADGVEYECKAKGVFRKDNTTPLVGDNAIIELMETGTPLIVELLERTNSLLRPKVANVTQGALVLSTSSPKPDLLLIDKLLVWTGFEKIKPLLIINKTDVAPREAKVIKQQYPDVAIVETSCKEHMGIEALKEKLKEERTVLCGQSAVGKSTLLNTLFPELNLQTGTLAKKTARGRHTTRHAELYICDGIEVIDTPGFSVLSELPIEEPEALQVYYGEFAQHAKNCSFSSCLHVSEPGCGIIAAKEEKLIDHMRYDRYLKILNQIMEARANKYD